MTSVEIEKDAADNSLFPESSDENESSLISIDEAKRQISPEVLSVLAEKFNGKLSGVRPVDPKDMLF